MSRPLRILQVAQRPQRRGAEVFAFQLARRLELEGCELRTVYLYPYEGAAPLPLRPHDVALHGDDSHVSERLLGFHPGLLSRFRAAVTDARPDVVQVNGARSVKYGALAHRLDRAVWALVYRNIGDPHDWVAGGRQRLFYQRVIMPELDGIVGVSAATLRNLSSYYPLNVATARIPRGVEVAALRPRRPRADVRLALGTPADAPVVLFVGSVTAEKRPDRLLRVFSRVRNRVSDAHLWVIGDGPLRRQLAADGAAAGLERVIAMPGTCEDVTDYLCAADVLLLTSDTEGTPGVVLEAGAVGLPAVATRVGGVSDCVRDGETGVLADPDDEQGLAAAVVALLRDAGRRQRMGARARGHVVASFSIEAVTAAYLEFYERVLRDMRLHASASRPRVRA